MSTDVERYATDLGHQPAGSSVQDFVVTFGMQYNTVPHPVIDHPRLADGYVVIEAPDYDTARRLAFALFGQKFSMIYDHLHRLRVEYYPLGELARYSWSGPGLNTLPEEDVLHFASAH